MYVTYKVIRPTLNEAVGPTPAMAPVTLFLHHLVAI